MHELPVEGERKVILDHRHQDKGVDRLVEPGEQTPGEAQRLVLVHHMVADDEFQVRHSEEQGDRAIHDFDRVGRDAHLRVENGLARPDVVLPLVPRAAQDLSLPPVAIFVDLRRQRRANDLPEANPRALMRAGILQRIKCPLEIENADLPPPNDPDNLPSPRRYLLRPRHHMPLHRYLPSEAHTM